MNIPSLFINFPFVTGLEETLPTLDNAGLFSLHVLKLDADLLPLILEARPCACIFSLLNEEQSVEIFALLRELKELRIARGSEERDPTLRIILIANDRSISVETWADLGVHEFIIAPVLPKALAFKLARHYHKALASAEIPEELPTAKIQAEEQVVSQKLHQWNFRIRSDESLSAGHEKIARVVVRANVPLLDADNGDWVVKTSGEDHFDDTWVWKASESGETSGDRTWTFSGDKPRFDKLTCEWKFKSETPTLTIGGKDDKSAEVLIHYNSTDGSVSVSQTEALKAVSVERETYPEARAGARPSLTVKVSGIIPDLELAPDSVEALINYLDAWKPSTKTPVGDVHDTPLDDTPEPEVSETTLRSVDSANPRETSSETLTHSGLKDSTDSTLKNSETARSEKLDHVTGRTHPNITDSVAPTHKSGERSRDSVNPSRATVDAPVSNNPNAVAPLSKAVESSAVKNQKSTSSVQSVAQESVGRTSATSNVAAPLHSLRGVTIEEDPYALKSLEEASKAKSGSTARPNETKAESLGSGSAKKILDSGSTHGAQILNQDKADPNRPFDSVLKENVLKAEDLKSAASQLESENLLNDKRKSGDAAAGTWSIQSFEDEPESSRSAHRKKDPMASEEAVMAAIEAARAEMLATQSQALSNSGQSRAVALQNETDLIVDDARQRSWYRRLMKAFEGFLRRMFG